MLFSFFMVYFTFNVAKLEEKIGPLHKILIIRLISYALLQVSKPNSIMENIITDVCVSYVWLGRVKFALELLKYAFILNVDGWWWWWRRRRW